MLQLWVRHVSRPFGTFGPARISTLIAALRALSCESINCSVVSVQAPNDMHCIVWIGNDIIRSYRHNVGCGPGVNSLVSDICKMRGRDKDVSD